MACTNLRLAAWLITGLFFVGFVLFFVSYVGNSWYVVPDDKAPYPPAPSSTYAPDNPKRPIKFGLFWMCVGTHCRYDLRVDYMIVMYLPYADIAYAYQQFRTAVMAITTIAAVFNIIALGLFLFFLSGFSISRFGGFAAGVAQIAAGIIEVVAVIIFGSKFRGSTAAAPFGWSFGLMIVALIILLISGVLTIILSIVINVRKRNQFKNSSGKPMAVDF